MKYLLGWLGAIVILTQPMAYGLDHKNIDEGRPTRLEDPYAIAHGEIALEGGVGYNNERQGTDRALVPVQILYGAFPNSHFELGSTFLTNPRAAAGHARSGDLELSGLYNFNQETLSVPAFGFKTTITFPTGVDSSGVDVEIKGIVAKSIARLSLFLNASHVFVAGTESQPGDDLHKILLGASYPIGAPRYTRTTIIADAFTEMSNEEGRSHIFGAELGFRHQLTQRIVLDAGAGTEFSGPSDRVPFLLRLGASLGI